MKQNAQILGRLLKNEICLVFDDKIYESFDKRILTKEVKQASKHPVSLNPNTNIIPYMITTANYASIFAQNLIYWNKAEYLKPAHEAIVSIEFLEKI